MLRDKITRLFLITLALLSPSLVLSQEVVIDDQAEFLSLVSGSDFVWDQNNEANGTDYTLNPGGGSAYTFTVPSGYQLTIEDGTIIHLAANVSLRIEGELVIINDQANGSGFSQTQICGMNESSAGQSPWGAIEVVGDEAFGDADGKLSLTNCLISGGGAGAGWASGTPDWAGLIRLQAPSNGDGPFKPELNLSNCTLQRSANNGIVVSSAGNISGAYIRINGLVMNRGVEDGIDYRIQACGVKLGDVNLNSIANDKLENDIEFVDAQIANCGLHGVFGWLSGGTQVFNKNTTSNYRSNGWRGSNYYIAGTPQLDYYPAKGAGIFLSGSGDLNGASDMDDILTISGVEVDNNSWDGVRLNNNWAKSTVELASIHGNGEAGVSVVYSATSRIVSVEKNAIYSNGFDGVFASKASGGYAAILIRGNNLYSNKTSGGAGAEVSEVRIKGMFGTHAISSGQGENSTDPEICNNSIHNGGYGISILRDGSPTYVYARKVVVENNFIYRLTQSGVVMDYDPTQTQDFLSPEVRNNTFYSVSVYGVKISANTPARTSGSWIQNNVFSSCGTGLRDESPDNNSSSPAFTYNGFYSNSTNAYGCVADGGTSQTGNPQFVSTTSGSEDFHLLWNSPLINRGDPASSLNDAEITYTLRYFPDVTGEAEEIPVDGSRNDIGATGGARAASYGYNPYNVISSAAHYLSGTMRSDYYRSFASFEVSNGQSLTIEEGTFVGQEADVQFQVKGELDVTGSVEHPVFFTGYNQARWFGISFNSTSSAYSDLSWLDISYANYYGVSFSSVPDISSQKITLDNCVVTHCRDYGISVYNSRIELTGNNEAPDPSEVDLETWVLPWGDEARGNTIRNISGSSSASQGIKLQYCGYGDVSITGTKIYLCGNDDAIHDQLETGIYIFDSDPTVLDATIFHNANTGSTMLLSAPTFNDYDASASRVNTFRDNGDAIDSTDGDGAELSVSFSSTVFGRYNNIWADDPAEEKPEPEKKKKGYLIWCANTGNVIMIANNYLGTDVVPLDNPGDFFNSVSQVSWQNNVATQMDNNWIADASPIQIGKGSFDDGNYEAARNRFRQIIDNNPTDPDAAAAIRFYVEASYRINPDFEDEREYLAGLAEDYPEMPVGLQAELLRPKTLVEERRFEDALGDYQNLAENGDNAAERGLGQVNALELERMMEGDEVQNFNGSVNDRINREVNDIVLSLLRPAAAAEALPPAEFKLVSAYPNPFNSTVKIKYSIPQAGALKLAVYDLAGREVALLQSGSYQQGSHTALWQADGFAAGLYVCRLESNGQTQSTKLLLVK